jgi:hypothetical protein
LQSASFWWSYFWLSTELNFSIVHLRDPLLSQTQVIRFRRPKLNQSTWNRELNPSLWSRQTNKMSDEVEEKVGRAYQSFGLAAAGT